MSRTFKGLLLEMNLEQNYEVKKACEDQLLNMHDDLKSQLTAAQKKIEELEKTNFELDRKLMNETVEHAKEYLANDEKNERIEQLEKVLVNARACLNAVIGSKEQWTLEQERIGNKAICLISIKEIEQALSQKGG